MRNDSWVTSAQYSDASSLAMPASTSLRPPESFSRAALTMSRWAASTLVAAAHLDSVHHLIEAPAAAGRAAEDSAGRQPDAVEHHLGGLDALVAHLVDLAGDGQARPGLAEPGLLLDQERGHVLVVRAAFRLAHRERPADLAAGHLRQQPLLLLLCPVLSDQVRHDEAGIRTGQQFGRDVPSGPPAQVR